MCIRDSRLAWRHSSSNHGSDGRLPSAVVEYRRVPQWCCRRRAEPGGRCQVLTTYHFDTEVMPATPLGRRQRQVAIVVVVQTGAGRINCADHCNSQWSDRPTSCTSTSSGDRNRLRRLYSVLRVYFETFFLTDPDHSFTATFRFSLTFYFLSSALLKQSSLSFYRFHIVQWTCWCKKTSLLSPELVLGPSYYYLSGFWLIPRLHDQANIKQSSSKYIANIQQTSSKYRAIRAHVVHKYFEYICVMFAECLLDDCLIV